MKCVGIKCGVDIKCDSRSTLMFVHFIRFTSNSKYENFLLTSDCDKNEDENSKN